MKVLVVEDETLVSIMIEDMLADMGHEIVGPASTVAEAMLIVERNGIDAAILDMNLGNGETAEPIADRLIAHGVKFGFVTGYASSSFDDRFADVPKLQKPFSFYNIQNFMDLLS